MRKKIAKLLLIYIFLFSLYANASSFRGSIDMDTEDDGDTNFLQISNKEQSSEKNSVKSETNVDVIIATFVKNISFSKFAKAVYNQINQSDSDADVEVFQLKQTLKDIGLQFCTQIVKESSIKKLVKQCVDKYNKDDDKIIYSEFLSILNEFLNQIYLINNPVDYDSEFNNNLKIIQNLQDILTNDFEEFALSIFNDVDIDGKEVVTEQQVEDNFQQLGEAVTNGNIEKNEAQQIINFILAQIKDDLNDDGYRVVLKAYLQLIQKTYKIKNMIIQLNKILNNPQQFTDLKIQTFKIITNNADVFDKLDQFEKGMEQVTVMVFGDDVQIDVIRIISDEVFQAYVRQKNLEDDEVKIDIQQFTIIFEDVLIQIEKDLSQKLKDLSLVSKF